MTPGRDCQSEPHGLVKSATGLASITPGMDRHNGRLFLLSYILIFLAGPVDYVGILQASLCDRLGATHTVANLPAATYIFGFIVPFVLSSFIPYRFERALTVIANLVTAASMGIVCVTLFLPFSNGSRVAAVIVQGVIMGFSACTSAVYILQCLGRGTTEKGRARTFKITFTCGPIAGILGSLVTQFILNGGVPGLRFPYDFGLVYLFGVPCMIGVAVLCSSYKMIWLEEQHRPPFFRSLVENVKSFTRNPDLLLLWFGYLLWYFTIGGEPNILLYSSQALHKAPDAVAGIAIALRFAGKSLGGFVLGVVATRYGSLAPAKLAIILTGSALAWALVVPGYSYLLAFALFGAGELGGAYIPNSALIFSLPETGARNLAVLALAGPVASIAPVIHGELADILGFHSSFAFGAATALLALWLVSRARSPATTEQP